MGRKTRRPVQTKRRPSIPRVFKCPKCEAQAIKIHLDGDIAKIDCGRCHLNMMFTEVKSVSEPVDIYGDFIDRYYLTLEFEEVQDSTDLPVPTVPVVEDGTENKIKIDSNSKTISGKDIESGSLEDEKTQIEEQTTPEPPKGFVPRSKADVLKAKAKQSSKTQN